MLVYDGDCGFCTSSAAWVARRLPPDSRVAAWQSLDLPELGLTRADVTSAAWWVDRDGGTHRGHAAIGHSLMAAGGAWAGIGWLIVHPPISWLARPAYALVARIRHRLPGNTDACRVGGT